ncbi:hypothetical protein THIAE_06010 [Thiomicrospira aerophila AL3]|uniref:Uncharacterized protein n=1 Tax=Thiomicrospira aerophila AL3 TaxID=717772 RepID=W0DZ72_9GAMM|nr:hypothetical protein THIAE_06010 [Thiomicrospira aerophila AL3]
MLRTARNKSLKWIIKNELEKPKKELHKAVIFKVLIVEIKV